MSWPIPRRALAAAIPAHLRGANGEWFALSLRDRVMYADKAMTIPTGFEYQALANPERRLAAALLLFLLVTTVVIGILTVLAGFSLWLAVAHPPSAAALLATLATLRADISHASTGRPGSRTTGRHSSGTPARATAHNCSTMPTPCIRSNTSSASVPGPRTAPSPGMRRAAAFAATSTRRTPSSRNSISARGSTSKKACRRACAEGASAPSPSGVRRSVSNSDEITFEHNPLVKRMFAWTRRRKARPHSPHRVCQKVTAT